LTAFARNALFYERGGEKPKIESGKSDQSGCKSFAAHIALLRRGRVDTPVAVVVTEEEQCSRRRPVQGFDTHIATPVGTRAAELPHMHGHAARREPFFDLVTKGPLIRAFHFSLLHAAFMIGLSAEFADV